MGGCGCVGRCVSRATTVVVVVVVGLSDCHTVPSLTGKSLQKGIKIINPIILVLGSEI